MSREMEYYEQFGALSCSDPGDRPSISDADESVSGVGDNPEEGDKSGSSDVEEEADAAGA